MSLFRIADNKIVEHRGVGDIFSILQQIGAVPAFAALPSDEHRTKRRGYPELRVGDGPDVIRSNAWECLTQEQAVPGNVEHRLARLPSWSTSSAPRIEVAI